MTAQRQSLPARRFATGLLQSAMVAAIPRLDEVGYGTFAPPLTLITSPTTKLDSGEARKT